MADQPLVIQPTLELLTPMVQNPHRLLRLAQMAEVETLDTMVGLRVGSDTLIRALDLGLTLEEMNALLAGPDAPRCPSPWPSCWTIWPAAWARWKSSRAAAW